MVASRDSCQTFSMKLYLAWVCSLGVTFLVQAAAAGEAGVNPVGLLNRELVAADGASGDSFGYSIALHGDIAVIGAPAATVGGNHAQGAVYVFQLIGSNWTQVQKLIANDGSAFDDFGNSVAFDRSTIIVGAPDVAIDGNAGQGAAYIFTLSGDVWSQTQKLLAADGALGNEFGESVAIQGDTAVIGAIQLLHGPGAAYIFNNTGSAWMQIQELTAAEGSATFGSSVALDGNQLLIGAQQTDVGGRFDEGAAFVFADENGTWSETAELTPGDDTMFDSFGGSVALEGPTALVGASGALIDGQQIGAAYLFHQQGGNWHQTQRLTATDARGGAGFGSSVSLSGNTACIGADQYATNGKGKAYLFENSDNTWTQANEVRAANPTGNDEFGWSGALDQRTLLIGAWGAKVNGHNAQGAAYVRHY